MTALDPVSTPRKPAARLRFLIVRHGETDQNVQHVIQGQLDTQLNLRGKEQACLAGDALKDEPIDEVYSSPLERARDTAYAIIAHHPMLASKLILDDRLKERRFGSLEGKVYKGPATKLEDTVGIERMPQFGERLASFWNDIMVSPGPWPSPSAAESQQHVAEPLADEVLDMVASRRLSSGSRSSMNSPCMQFERTIVLVSHGAAISALVGGILLGGHYVYLAPGVSTTRIWNTSITEVIVPSFPATSLPSKPSNWIVRPPHMNPPSTAKGGSDSVTLTSADGKPLGDIGFGPGRGVVERWADIRHLPHMLDGATATKNADELVTEKSVDENKRDGQL